MAGGLSEGAGGLPHRQGPLIMVPFFFPLGYSQKDSLSDQGLHVADP
jgi:hypothetical protein